MKGLLSFRTKLILSVFPVVAAVTTAALWVAELKFSRSYEQLFRQQFDGQIELLVESREKRSEVLSAALERLVQLPAVVEGMRSHDVREIQQELRPQLEKLLRERLSLGEGAGPGRAGGADFGPRAAAGGGGFLGGGEGRGRPLADFAKGGDTERRAKAEEQRGPGAAMGGRGGVPTGGDGFRPPQRQASFVALIDSEGLFIKGQRDSSLVPLMLDESSENDGTGGSIKRDSGSLPWLGGKRLSEVLLGLEVGYFVVEVGADGNEQIREVFVTPIRDPEDDRFLGALIVGIPMAAAGERLLFEQTRLGDMGEIRSGVWVENRLMSSTIPGRYATVIESYVRELEAGAAVTSSETRLEIEGKPYRLLGRLLNPASPFPKAAQVSLYPLKALDQEVGDLRRSVAGLGVGALALAFGLVMFVSRGLSEPLQKLAIGVEEIEKGNYTVRVPVTSRDEVGQLASAFNDMAAGLLLQEKYRSVLNAVADRTVAQKLIENQHALGGELRDVTMLFCDIRGFTALTEHMSPAEVIDLLNQHMTALTDVAYAHGGIVDKFVGDLIMVLFGAPVSSGNDAANAVACAIEMQNVRRRMNATAEHPLEMGIGLTTGDVVAGCMGSDQRLSYTVLGSRVNLAARLCGVAQAGEILVDESTWTAATGMIEGEPIPPVTLKGFSEPVACFRVKVGQ